MSPARAAVPVARARPAPRAASALARRAATRSTTPASVALPGGGRRESYVEVDWQRDELAY